LSSNVRNRPTAKVGQRERLIAGMTQAASRYGYKDASVARVVEQAGVSRATFYEHFVDKEACFLAAFEQAAERIEVALPRVEAEYSPALRAEELTDDLIANIVRDPAAARILLLEAQAGGPQVRKAYQCFMDAVEATFARWLDGPGENGYRLGIAARAIREGTGGILVMRSFRGETARLADLRDDLLAWLYAYSIPEDHSLITSAQWRRLGAGLVRTPVAPDQAATPARKLPRGKSAAAPGAVAGEHRERILAAVALLVQSKGFAAMTVADIVKGGAVTREVFYDLFRSKEDAFLAAQTAGLEASISLTATAFFAGESWPQRVWDGLEALLGYVALQPDLVYLDVIESFAAGAGAIRRSFDNRMAYTLFLEDGYRQSRAIAAKLPRLCSEAIGHAIIGLMRSQVVEGRTEQMMELLPEAVYLALAPFIGPAAAIEVVETRVAASGDAATA
jgi:AcrR family transcriptional regulator